jgi:MFS family permease
MCGVNTFPRDSQYFKFSAYGFLKNLRFFEPFMILFLLDNGVSFLQVGTLYAVREIAVNILEIPTGAVADAVGRRRTMVSSFVSYLLSFVLFWFGSSFAQFLVAMVFFSFGEAFRTGTHKAMIFTYLRINSLQEHSNDYYGHTRAWSQTGSALSSLIAAAIVFGSGNYRAVFLFSMIPYVLDLVLMLTYPAELDGERGTFSWNGVKSSFRALGKGLRETIARPGATRSVMSAAVFSGYFRGAKDYLQPMLAALALSLPVAGSLSGERREAIVIGFVYTAIYLMTSLASRNSGPVARQLGSPERALNWELLVGFLLAVAAGLSRAASLAILPVAFFVAIYILQNLRQPVGVTVVASRVPEPVLATVLSVESQLQSLFAAAIAFTVGAFADLSGGNVGFGLAGAAVVGLIMLPLLWISRLPGDHTGTAVD